MRADGLASCLGTASGGCVHVLAGAAGVSALVVASATAFTALKLAGGLYLVFLGIQTWRSAAAPTLAPGDTAGSDAIAEGDPSRGAKRRALLSQCPRRAFRGRAFRRGAVVEATNPKTAAFFLALIPRLIDVARGGVASQFVVLGLVSVALNTGMAVLVVSAVSALRGRLAGKAHVVRRLRQGSGVALGGLGVSLLFARRPA